jgi:hypothetical protein
LSKGKSDSVGMRETLQAWVAALVTVVLWVSAFVGIRAAGEDLSPGPLSLARLLVGSAALGAFVLFRRERFPARRDLPAIAMCGVLWFGLYNVVLDAAERLVDAGTASMLVGVRPRQDDRREDGRDHLPDPARGRLDGVDDTRGGTPGPRLARRRAVPRIPLKSAM